MFAQLKNCFDKSESLSRSRFHHYIDVFALCILNNLNREIIFVFILVCCQHFNEIFFLMETVKNTDNITYTIFLIFLYLVLKLLGVFGDGHLFLVMNLDLTFLLCKINLFS